MIGSGSGRARFTAATPRSRALFERARAVMPGGVAKGAYFHAPYPLHLAAGSGAYVTSVDGQRLLDLRGHHTATILGHRPPDVDAALRAQLERGIALGGPTEAEVALAEGTPAKCAPKSLNPQQCAPSTRKSH